MTRTYATPEQRFKNLLVRNATLRALMARGAVYLDKDDVIGIAADGVHVSIGSVCAPATLAAYLEAYPTPEDW